MPSLETAYVNPTHQLQPSSPDSNLRCGLSNHSDTHNLPLHPSLDDSPTSLLAQFTADTAIIENFFVAQGAYRPPVPCQQCLQEKLHCLVLQTSAANPNPYASCSSCITLYRECSLAERERSASSTFETVHSAISSLHSAGREPDLDSFDDSWNDQHAGSAEPASTKRAGLRHTKKTRALSNWFASHMEHPYPSEEDKITLAEESGMTKKQVVDWFANSRRRLRLSTQATLNTNTLSPQRADVPNLFGQNITSLDRWPYSSPKDDLLSNTTLPTTDDPGIGPSTHSPYLGSFEIGRGGSISSVSGESFHYPAVPNFSSRASISGASVQSFNPSDIQLNISARGSIDESVDGESSASGTKPKAMTFQCTFCWQSFRKRYDWVRHERSIHLPRLDSWICRVPLPADQSFLVWRAGSSVPQCIFCGHPSPTHEHIQSHEFQSCFERPESERTFTRKDHLWQHLHKFHRCRKWEGWKMDLNLLQHRQDTVYSRCGFCQMNMSSWDERIQHLASHFRHGASQADWVGGSGVQLPDGTEAPNHRTR